MGQVRSSVWLGSIVIKRSEGSLVSLKDKEIVKLYSHFCHNKSIPMFLKKKKKNKLKALLEDGISGKVEYCLICLVQDIEIVMSSN